MAPWRSLCWLTLAVVAAVALAPAPAPGPAEGQTGSTVVLALDQEPPTLDPHASPSGFTYQIIASVTESLLHRGPDGKLTPAFRCHARGDSTQRRPGSSREG